MASVLEPDTITVIEVEPVEVKQEEVVEQQEEVHTGPQPFEGIIAIGCNVMYYGKKYVFAIIINNYQSSNLSDALYKVLNVLK